VDSSRSALASQVEFQHPQSKLIPRISAGMASPSVLAMDSIAQTPHQTAISTSRNPARFQGLGIAVENGGPLRNIGDRVEADSGIQGVYLVVLSFMSLHQICEANRPLSLAQEALKGWKTTRYRDSFRISSIHSVHQPIFKCLTRPQDIYQRVGVCEGLLDHEVRRSH
jgi:hypothetical protein